MDASSEGTHNVWRFGAKGNGTRDDSASIQAAIDAARVIVKNISGTTIQGVTRTVYLPAGVYVLNSGLTIYQGIRLCGASQGSVVLDYTGTGGNAITLDKDTSSALYGVNIDEMTILDSGTGAHGIYVPDVGSAQAIRNCGLNRVAVIGFDENLHVADSWTFSTTNCLFQNAANYNARLINATAQKHTNTRFDIAGLDSVLIEKSASNQTVSAVFNGCTFQGAQRWGLRAVDTVSLELYGCFFEDNSNEDATYGCLKTEDSVSSNTRHIKVSGGNFSATGGTANQTGISIDRARHVVIDTNIDSAAFGTGIVLGANVQNAFILGNNDASTKITSSATRLTTRLYNENWQHYEDVTARKITGQSFSTDVEFTIADDDVATVAFDVASSRGIISIAGNSASAQHAIVAFRVASSQHVSLIGGTANVAVTTGSLTGTTGVDGNLTISAHTDNNIYIENRTGASRSYQITVMSNAVGRVTGIS